jgi:hypothetical protein
MIKSRIMKAKFRYARPTNQLKKISEMYQEGLELEVLGSFENHKGFDGVILGNLFSDYHFEFTQQKGVLAPCSPSPENLIVFYLPESSAYNAAKLKMSKSGFTQVPSHNPYWDDSGCTFEDPEGYRIVLCNRKWA